MMRKCPGCTALLTVLPGDDAWRPHFKDVPGARTLELCRHSDMLIPWRLGLVRAGSQIGFTATRSFDVLAERIASDWLLARSRRFVKQEGLMRRPRFITGACRGGDAFIGKWLVNFWRDKADHLVIVPANLKQVHPWWLYLPGEWQGWIQFITMPPGSSYEDRNRRIVDLATTEIDAFPRHLDRRLDPRSGTHQTIRLAREAGRLGDVVPVAAQPAVVAR